MRWITLLDWLKQRPWLLLPVFALLPLSTLLWVSRSEPSANVSPQPLASGSPSPTPSIALVPLTPNPTPSSSPKSVAPKPPASASLPKQAGVQTPHYTGEEALINQKGKAAFGAMRATVDAAIEMRVAIADGVSSVAISSSTPAQILSQDGKPLGSLEAQTGYAVTADGQGLQIGASALPGVVMVDPGPMGMFAVGDRTYRGRLVLVSKGSSVWAVNHVSLRRYLHSVVASEVSPSWQMEALKAQAIAARSYALTYHFKPVSTFYDMGDDEYYQVYSGISREDPRTNQAVDLTAGHYVSYKGGVVESLYAASDDIVAEAFQGHGMSQLGALSLAEQGYTYSQILGNYYPGTKVGRIEMDHQ